jgi:lipopolysaccharide/colanic/teichoic acid biosynthesis glycosyltransferase
MPLLRLVRSRIVGVEAMIRFGVDVLLASVLFATLAPAVVLVLAGGWVRGVRPLIDRRNVVGRHGTVVSLPLLSSRLTDNMLVHGAPALLLVIRGQLALAGPKPTPVEEQDRAHQWRGLLQSVRPGLTGPWRLMRTPSTPAERTLADIWWVHNWTIWQHLFVLIQTGRRMIWRASQDVTPLERWTYLDGAAEAPLQPPRVEVAA